MQRNQKSIYERCYIAVIGVLWVTGLLIAGSDSIYMPWVNGVGLILFLLSSVMLGKYLHRTRENHRMVIFPGFYPRQGISVRPAAKENCRVSIRYAFQAR